MSISGGINPSFRIELANDLLAAYAKKRDEDFGIMEGMINYDTDANALLNTVEVFIDWKARFKSVVKESFNEI